MSMCNNDCRGMDRNSTLFALLHSIALQEAGLARILNAEGEKIEKAVCLSNNINELIAINESVQTTIETVNNLEDSLREKAIAVLNELNGRHGSCN